MSDSEKSLTNQESFPIWLNSSVGRASDYMYEGVSKSFRNHPKVKEPEI